MAATATSSGGSWLSLHRRAERVAIRAALRGMEVAKDIVLATPEEVDESRDMVGTLIRPALREGKVLYERVG